MDDLETLTTVTLTQSEWAKVINALDITAGLMEGIGCSDESLIAAVRVRHRIMELVG